MSKKIKRMTEQQAFNKVWRWFVRDRKPQSLDAQMCCVYRGPDGVRCAAGVCIPDRLYNPDMEGGSYPVAQPASRAIAAAERRTDAAAPRPSR